MASGDGVAAACGSRVRNRWRLSCDKASARMLLTPRIWVATRCNSPLAAKKARHLISCMVLLSFDIPVLMMATTAMLSHWILTTEPHQRWPHSAAATTIGASSLMVMCASLIGPDHGSMNQLVLECAPQPQLLDASDVTIQLGGVS